MKRLLPRFTIICVRGDTYQVNYTVQLKQDLSTNPFAIYNRMVVEQEAGYNAYVEHDEMAVISMSPELFLSKMTVS